MKTFHGLLLAAAAALAGCDSDDGIVRPPPTDIRVFNAATSYDAISFVREERIEAQLPFGLGTAKTFDSGPYDFHLEYISAITGGRIRVETFPASLAASYNYTFVAVSDGNDLRTLTVATEDPPASTTTSRYHFIHAHPSFGPFDLYVFNPSSVTDCQVAGTTPRGRASFGPTAVSFDLVPGIYRICMTAPDDPSTVLYQSSNLTTGAIGGDFVFIAYDSIGLTVSDISVSIMDSSPVPITQAGISAKLRFLQTVDDGLPRDIFRNDETTPIFPAPLEAGVFSDYIDLPSGLTDIELVPVGGGDPEAAVSLSPTTGSFATLIFAGDTTDGVLAVLLSEDRRRLAGQATARIIHAAGMHDAVEVFIRRPGSDINVGIPITSFAIAPSTTSKLALVPGDFEITVRSIETAAILAGPELVTLQERGVYGIALFNNPADPATVSLGYFYDQPL